MRRAVASLVGIAVFLLTAVTLGSRRPGASVLPDQLETDSRRAWNACRERLEHRVPFPAYADSFIRPPGPAGSRVVWGPYPEYFECEVLGDSIVRVMVSRE